MHHKILTPTSWWHQVVNHIKNISVERGDVPMSNKHRQWHNFNLIVRVILSLSLVRMGPLILGFSIDLTCNIKMPCFACFWGFRYLKGDISIFLRHNMSEGGDRYSQVGLPCFGIEQMSVLVIIYQHFWKLFGIPPLSGFRIASSNQIQGFVI